MALLRYFACQTGPTREAWILFPLQKKGQVYQYTPVNPASRLTQEGHEIARPVWKYTQSSVSWLSLFMTILILYSFFPKHENYKLCKWHIIQFIICAPAFLSPLWWHFCHAREGSEVGPHIFMITEKLWVSCRHLIRWQIKPILKNLIKNVMLYYSKSCLYLLKRRQ